jgi:hypothetical protein
MPEPTDISLDNAGYMLAPGSYQRSQDGAPEGRTGRIVMRDFFGGQRRALQLERDRGWGGIRTGPSLDGQGVVPWPLITSSALDPSSEIPAADAPIPTATVNAYVYFAIGSRLYRTTSLSAGNWNTPLEVWNAGAGKSITSLAWYNDDLLIALGTTDDLMVFQYPSGPATPLLSGERARHVVGYAGFAMWSKAQFGGATGEIRMVTGSGVESRYLDARVTHLTTAGGKVWAASNTSLYTFTGRVRETLVPNPAWTSGSTDPTSIPALRWSGEWTPFFQHGSWSDDDDYAFLLGFGGRLITWLGKRVVEHNPSGERAGWRDLGLGGRICRGACIAGGFLVVALQSTTGAAEVWVWNGAGWWLALQDSSGVTSWIWPTSVSGAGNWDVLLFRDGSLEIDLIRLHWRSDTKRTLPENGTYVSSMLDASERDKDKAWRKVGAVFASPDVHGISSSSDQVTVALEWSVDAGLTWNVAASRALTASANDARQFEVNVDIASDVAVGRWIQLRVSWTSVSAWAPVLVGLWAEFEVLDAPARRRRWQLSVVAHDQVVRRDGGEISRSGRELIADLWDAWQSGTTLPYRDIDFDASPIDRQIRIVGIREDVARPADAGAVGDALVHLTLVEV